MPLGFIVTVCATTALGVPTCIAETHTAVGYGSSMDALVCKQRAQYAADQLAFELRRRILSDNNPKIMATAACGDSDEVAYMANGAGNFFKRLHAVNNLLRKYDSKGKIISETPI